MPVNDPCLKKKSINCFIMRSKESGFTLVEIMIAMLISGIVMTSIYSAFQSQQNTYIAQEQVAEMQQNIRAGLNIMMKEIRMAGYDPTENAGATITAASNNSISFTMDSNGDGDTSGDSGEVITYSLYTTTEGINALGRKNPTINQAVAENIEQLEFYYTLDGGTQTLTSAVPSQIRSVRISILAKAGKSDRNFKNTKTYLPGSNVDLGTQWGPYNDNFRRRLLITTVQCRNMGI